jgi:hypothetical protein
MVEKKEMTEKLWRMFSRNDVEGCEVGAACLNLDVRGECSFEAGHAL